jgi:hypothetical protein
MTKELERSFVMRSYNRAETLHSTLCHLAEQELDPATYSSRRSDSCQERRLNFLQVRKRADCR